jgi:tetraacyldisaccharide 4'-kinase
LLEKLWYKRNVLCWFLWPFSIIYQFVIKIRRFYLQKFCCYNFDVPIIVVGNISVGGVGKTPFVIALANKLTQQGMRVGIVSRGYGAKIKQFPHEVSVYDSAKMVGDEPLLLAQKTNIPVIIAPKRIAAVKYLLQKYAVEVVISDDGLQHYRMGRKVEIAIIDKTRGLGNGLCLPAGPLREPPKRLQQVDFVVTNGDSQSMQLCPGEITQLTTGNFVEKTIFMEPIAAVAGIGNPQRFFTTLRALDISFNPYPFKDHHKFVPRDLDLPEKNVIMTEKDAVKCLSFATDNMYFLPVTAQLNDLFWQKLLQRISK